MKIMRKNGKEYCNFAVWYLTEVRNKATASELASYAQEHKLVNRCISLNSEMIGMALKDCKIIKRTQPRENAPYTYQLDPYRLIEDYL